MRRTARYFHSLARPSAPLRVREPQTIGPVFGKLRRQFTPSGLIVPFSGSVSPTSSASTPTSVASMPAADFHTPRDASVRAITPATAPPGANGSGRFSASGLAMRMRGKNSAAFSLRAATAVMAPEAVTSAASPQPEVLNGGSTSTHARRSFAYATAASQVGLSTSAVAENGGTTSRLNRSAFSSAKMPCLVARSPGSEICVASTSLPSSAEVEIAVAEASSNGSGAVVAALGDGRLASVAAGPRSSLLDCFSTSLTKRGAPSVIETFRCDSVTPVPRSLTRRLNSVSGGFAPTTAGSMSLSTRMRSLPAQAPGFAAVKVALPPASKETLPVPGTALA